MLKRDSLWQATAVEGRSVSLMDRGIRALSSKAPTVAARSDAATGIGIMPAEVLACIRSLACGRPMTLLRPLARDPFVDRFRCKMQVSEDLGAIDIAAEGVKVGIPVSSIAKVYLVEDDGVDVLPREMARHISQSEASSLLCIYCDPSKGTSLCICVLDQLRSSRLSLLWALVYLKTRAGGHDVRASNAHGAPTARRVVRSGRSHP